MTKITSLREAQKICKIEWPKAPKGHVLNVKVTCKACGAHREFYEDGVIDRVFEFATEHQACKKPRP